MVRTLPGRDRYASLFAMWPVEMAEIGGCTLNNAWIIQTARTGWIHQLITTCPMHILMHRLSKASFGCATGLDGTLCFLSSTYKLLFKSDLPLTTSLMIL